MEMKMKSTPSCERAAGTRNGAGGKWTAALIVGAMITALAGTANARDRGFNQPGALGNTAPDPGVNQPGAVGNVGRDRGVNQPGAAGNVGRDPGVDQPGAAGNRGPVRRRYR